MKICLFKERCIQIIGHVTFGQFLIKYGLVFYKNGVIQIYTKYFVGSSQKNSTFVTRKMKNEFFMQIKWKLPLENFLASTIYTHMQNMRSFGKTIL